MQAATVLADFVGREAYVLAYSDIVETASDETFAPERPPPSERPQQPQSS